MKTSATTIPAYLDLLPPDRRAALDQLLAVIRGNLPRGYEEAFAFGMIAWQVPLSVYPDTYNDKPLMYAALASQKNHLAVYLCGLDVTPGRRAAFEASWARSGKKKLDMGGSCVRFRRIEDVALDAIGEVVASTAVSAFVAAAKAAQARTAAKPAPAKKVAKQAVAGKAAKPAPAQRALPKKSSQRA
jgi:hypothetical protein